MDSGPGLLGWAACLVLVTTPATLLHELGHAIAARRRLPGEVRVTVGRGSYSRFRRGGIDFEVSLLTAPLGHAGTCVYNGLPSAGDALAIALAGPAATLLGFLLSLAALGATSGFLHEVAWTAALLQGGGVVLNLVPFRLGPGRSSDGKAALDALRHRP